MTTLKTKRKRFSISSPKAKSTKSGPKISMYETVFDTSGNIHHFKKEKR